MSMTKTGDSGDLRRTFGAKLSWGAALEWLHGLNRRKATGATTVVDSTLLGRAVRTSRSADQLARKRDFESSVLLYEQATQQVLEMSGQGHSSVLAVHAAQVDASDTELPAAVRLARARLRAAVAHEFGEATRQTAARVRRLARRLLLVSVLCMLAWLAAALWRHRAERDLAVGAEWTLSSVALNSAQRGKLTALNWWGDHPNYIFHSDTAKPPNVTVDLGAKHVITRVAITNRLDCCLERAVGLELETSLDGEAFSAVRTAGPSQPFRFFTFEFPARDARFVRLSLPKDQYLHLAELKVYGK